MFPKNWNLGKKETGVHTCALVAYDSLASCSPCRSALGLPAAWTAAAWGNCAGLRTNSGKVPWADLMAHQPEAVRLLLSFPPLLTVGQLSQLFRPRHGLVGLADPAANYFFFFFSSPCRIKELSWHMESSSRRQIQHKTGSENYPVVRAKVRRRPPSSQGEIYSSTHPAVQHQEQLSYSA